MIKKILLLSVFGLWTINSYAGIVTYDSAVSANDVTTAWLNGAKDFVALEFNGNIESINIRDDTLTEPDFADAINPRVRDYEFLGNFTYTGHLPATSANLTSDISAGTSYVNGYRLVTSATSKTYTASRDTWTYIDQNGAFQYVEVANGAAQPTTPANSLLLATVVTDADNITGVTDRRQLVPPNLRVYQDYRQGCIVSYDTAATIKINAGEIELGAGAGVGKRRNTTTISLAWSDLDTGAEAAGTQYFVWAYPNADNATNFAGKISASSSDATGITNERLIGWFYNDESSNISKDAVGNYKGDGSGIPNITITQISSDYTATSTTYEDMPGMLLKFRSSGRPVKLSLNGGSASTQAVTGLYTMFNVNGNNYLLSEKRCGGSAIGYDQGFSNEYIVDIGAGFHTIKVRIKMDASSEVTLKNRTLIAEEK